ncbi:MAG: hypothetical protein GY708_18830 [Actinomycetia bacterium]|nr:hypothetical protein [Actinomycetes bacterium]MCP4958843.1 hypothetical protein [Actinomycetes bacterium]
MRRSALSLAVVALLGAACGSSSTTDKTSQDATSSQAAAATAPSTQGNPESAAETRPAVLALARETLDGSQLAVDQFSGKDVLIWFWAPW